MRKKNAGICFLLCLCLSATVMAQPFVKEIPGTLLFTLKKAPSGNFVVGGQNAAGNKIAFGQYTPQGNVIFNKTLTPNSGSITYDPFHNRDIMLMDGDSLVFTNWSSGTLGTHNAVAKTNLDGNVGWWKVYQNDLSTNTPRGGAGGLFKTSTSHYINGAWSYQVGPVSFDYGAHIQKTDLQGQPIWSRHFIGTGFTFLYGATEGANGNYLFVGGSSSVLAINTNTNGDPNWMYNYKVETKSTEGIGLLPTTDNGFIIAGSHIKVGTTSDFDALIMKIDAQGNVVWAKSIEGPGNDYFYNVRKTSDGGFIACGKTASYGAGNDDGLLVKFTAAGTVQWSKTVGTAAAETINDVLQEGEWYYTAGGVGNAGMFAAVHGSTRLGCGETNITPNVRDITSIIVRTARTYAYKDYVLTLADNGVAANLNVTVANACSLDTTLLQQQICPATNYNFHGTQVSQPGVYYHRLTSVVTGRDSILKLTLSNFELPQVAVVQNGNILSANTGLSSFQWYLNGNPIAGATQASYTIQAGGRYHLTGTTGNGCVVTSAPVEITADGGLSEALLLPNPAKDYVTIRFPQLVKGVYVTIVSTESKKLQSTLHTYTNSIRLDVRHLPEGTYLVKLNSIDGAKKSLTLIKGR